MTDEINKDQNAEAQAEAQIAEQPAQQKKPKRAKKKRTKEQKRQRTVKALCIVAAIVLVLGLFVSGVAIGNVVGSKALLNQAYNFSKVTYDHEQLKPVRSDTEWTYFTLPEGRDFKVMQLTDVHIGAGSFSQQKDAWAMNAVATMIREEQPDLVVVTGDIAYPVPFQAGTFNNLNATKIFANMMESLGVYWTFAFGNHDTEAYSMYGRDDVCKYYEDSNFEYCLFERGFADEHDEFGDIDRGFGNHIINVKNADGKVVKSLVIFDSHSYTDNDYFGMAWKYDNIHQSQVDWYTAEMDKIKTANGDDKCPENLAFFHIPLMEYREAWRAIKDTYNSQPSAGDKATASKDYTESKEDGEVVFHYGVMGESEKTRNGVQSFGIFCGYGTDNVFEEGLTHNLKGIFCGHDHYNNFSIEYKGIRLTYGMSVDYLAYPGIYKEHSQRGCTIISIGESGFDCEQKNYYSYNGVTHEAE